MTVEEKLEALRINIESLHSNVSELYEAISKESETIRELRVVAQQDGENIRALARIAEIHEPPALGA